MIGPDDDEEQMSDSDDLPEDPVRILVGLVVVVAVIAVAGYWILVAGYWIFVLVTS